MKRRGRDLELLVSRLEQLVGGLDDRVEIKSPDYIPDKDTGELREVDVALRTRMGSAGVLVVLETRDRADVR
jgi:hypothetical protein